MERKQRQVCVLCWIAAIAWGLFAFVLAGQTAEVSGGISLSIGRRILSVLKFLPYTEFQVDAVLRKLAHAFVFIVQGMLLSCALLVTFTRRKRLSFIISLAVCCVLSVLNELMQLSAEGRSCELRDMFIDLAGAAFGIFIVWLIHRTHADPKKSILHRGRGSAGGV